MLRKSLIIAALSCTLFASATSWAQEQGQTPDADAASPSADAASSSAEGTQAAETASALPALDLVSEDTQAVYREYKKAAERYRKEMDSYKLDLRRTLMNEYQTRLSSVDAAYADKISLMRTEEAAMRTEVIRRMEEFLRKYGEHDKKSADILYRLARLYYEEADDLFLQDETGSVDHPDFTKALAMLAKLENNFPDYYQMDGALYLKGYCLQQMGEEEKGRDAFVDLLARYPNTTRKAEILTRIGEYYFTMSQDAIMGFGGGIHWKEALTYYEQAVAEGDKTSVYDRALYRKAWTEYYLDRYGDMINDFIALVGYADRTENGSALRSEAIDFMAAALAEEDWDLTDDVSVDPDYGIKRFDKYLKTGQGFENEVLRKFADTLFNYNRLDLAAEAYQTYLDRSNCEEDVPEVLKIFINTLNQTKQNERATKEQAMIGKRIGPDSKWYRCQEKMGNLEALAAADSVQLIALKTSIAAYQDKIVKTEQEIQKYTDIIEDPSATDEEKTVAAYKLNPIKQVYNNQNIELATALESILRRYPDSEDSYNFRYTLGQAWFNAMEYQKSIDVFMGIRDIKNEHFQPDVARYVADAWEQLLRKKAKYHEEFVYALPIQEIADRVNAGDLSIKKAPMSLLIASSLISKVSEEVITKEHEARKCNSQPLEMPSDVEKLVEARETFSAIENSYGVNDSESSLAPQYRYDNAMIYYNYGNMDEAEKRFMLIIENNPHSEHAVSAAEIVIAKYEDCNELTKVAELSEKFASMNLGADQADAQDGEMLTARFNDLKYQALFKIAFQLFDDKKYLEAAAEFLRIIEENPTFEHNNLALYNAAYAYEQLKYYDSSMQLYRRVLNEYGQTKEAVNALFQIGANAEKFFDFDTAVDSFLSLYNNKSENYQSFARRVDALRSAARIKLLTEDQLGAAELLVRYHKDFPLQPDAPGFYYQAGRVYAENGKLSEAQKIFNQLRKTYSQDVKVRPYLIASYLIEAKALRDKKPKVARDNFETAVTLYQNSPNAAGELGRLSAAEAAYNLVDMDRETWADEKITGKMKAMIEKLQKHMAEMSQLNARFTSVNNYGVKTWALAASYQRASMMQDTVDMLENINRPSDVKNGSDNHLAFLASMSDMATAARDAAIQAYKETIEVGKHVPGGAEWIQKSIDGLKQLDRTASSLERMLNATTQHNAGAIISNEVWQQHVEDEKKAVEAEKAAEKRRAGNVNESGEVK